MNNQPTCLPTGKIGILDSGVGGLSIWKEIVRKLPNESTIYLADSVNCPYGDKTPKEIYILAKRLVEFLLEKKVKLIVLACNTITVFCIDRLRSDFPQIPIVGTVPAVKTAAQMSKNKKIGILSTESTAKSNYQKGLIKKFAKDCFVINKGDSELVPYIEKGDTKSEKVKKILRDALEEFLTKGVDTITLGCSHFPFLKTQIQDIMGDKIKILDSGKAIARQVKRVLTNNNHLYLSNNPSYTFYTTGNTEEFTQVSRRLLGRKISPSINEVHKVSL